MESKMVSETKSRKSAPATAEPAKSTGRKFKEIEQHFVILDDQPTEEDGPTHVAQIEGTLTDVSSQTFRQSDNREPAEVGRYKLMDDDGVTWTVLGSTSLDDQMSVVAVGTYVRISYKGTIRSSNKRNVKQYKVETAID